MYKIITIEDEVRVPPTKFGMDIKDAIKDSLEDQLEGKIKPDIGVFLAVTEILDVKEGKIIPNDGAIYYPSKLRVLVFNPEDQEVLPGVVVDITEFGAFIRIGPLDGLVHVSQIIDDRISYDAKNATFVARKSKKTLKEGDVVRCRIVGVSLGKAQTKISLTMRQPWLGSMKWIEADKKALEKKPKAKSKVKTKK
ncbi:MAG: DNA-directed RNA polymerase [Candidatus Aenigmarchaeota archaeon ex4484_14]|nr:MAG: DNA-directed RNA polymerase [Candidatus Aenigmarchaeota archaeon ex4484_14]